MRRNHPRHLDRRRNLTPRDYASEPSLFGVVYDLEFIVPEQGDEVSKRVAHEQNLLVCEWERRDRQPSAARLGTRFGLSKQTLSKVTRGERWAGETGLAALTHATRSSADRRTLTPRTRLRAT